MTTFSQAPKLLKGAIVTFDLPDTRPNLIIFQYNPGTLSRSFQGRAVGSEGGTADVQRFSGAPMETISVKVEIDAADQLEQARTRDVDMGIYPQLAALEILLYPKSSDVSRNIRMLSMGSIEIIPPPAPFTLFVYGPRRILPIQLTELTIEEEAHDASLNPIRATVSLSMQVLSYNELQVNHPGHAVFMAYQKAKEKMAGADFSRDFEATGTTINLR